MSSLSQMLERRRAAGGSPSPACHHMEAQPACLIVTTGSGESWVFPWTQLAAAQFSKTDQRESLRLVFTSHEVRLAGMNLAPLRDLIATLQLARIQPAPTKYRPTADTEPFLESIQVAAHKAAASGEGASA